MKATQKLQKVLSLSNKQKAGIPIFRWRHHGETFSRNGHTVTELEVHTHHRLESRSQVERFTS